MRASGPFSREDVKRAPDLFSLSTLLSFSTASEVGVALLFPWPICPGRSHAELGEGSSHNSTEHD